MKSAETTSGISSARIILLCLALGCAGPVAADHETAQQHLRDGLDDYFSGDYAAAEVHFSDAMTEDPAWAIPVNNRGMARYHQGNYSGADSDFDAAKNLDSSYVAPYLNKGKSLAAQGLLDDALSELQAGLAIDPHHAKLLFNIGWVRDEKGEYTQALSSYEAALDEDPGYVRALAGRAVTLAGQGNTTDAVTAFYDVVNTAEEGDLLAAEAAYNLQLMRGAGLDFSSDTAAASYEQGLHDMSLGRWDLAVTEFSNAWSDENDVPDIPWMRYFCELHRGDETAAGTALDQAKALMPEIDVENSVESRVFLDGIWRDTTPSSIDVFPSRFDLTQRATGGATRERMVPVYGDSTAGGISPVEADLEEVEAYSDFKEIPDTDSDWLADLWEEENFAGLDPAPGDDPDGDGDVNLVEYWSFGTPDLDSDGDGIPDGWETANGLSMSDDRDLDDDDDGDSVPNYAEWLLKTGVQDAAEPAARIYVDAASGDDTSGDGSADHPFRSITKALTEAGSPAVVLIGPGNYEENITLGDRILLVGSGRDETILDADGGVRAVALEDGAAAGIVGMTLTGGYSTSLGGDGAGIRGSSVDAYLLDTSLSDNHALHSYATGGGGSFVAGGSLRVARCMIKGNEAGSVGGGLFLQNIDPAVITGTVFSSNSGRGESLRAEGGEMRITSSTVNGSYHSIELDNNTTSIDNSIIRAALTGSSGSLTISHSGYTTISHNGTVTWGDGLISGADPLFFDEDHDDLRLRPDSPFIDAGDGDTARFDDYFEKTRWDDPNTTDAGTGSPTYADIGFHEFRDTDADGLEDSWEEEHFGDLSHDGTVDTDTDGLSDLEEYTRATLPGDPDCDDDGLSDGDEFYSDGSHHDTDGYVTDPWDADSDDDGLGDGDEHTNGCDPNDADSDNDGISDGYEVDHGFDPLDDRDLEDDFDGDGLPNYAEWLIGSDPGDGTSPTSLHVDAATGSDDSGDGSQTAPFASITKALTTSTPPTAIRISRGTFSESLSLPDSIALVGEGALQTIIDAGGSGRAVLVYGSTASPKTAALIGLGLTGGAVDDGGAGLYGRYLYGIYLNDIRVASNDASSGTQNGGGCLFDRVDAVRIASSTILSNQASGWGGGVSITNDLHFSDVDVVVYDTLIADNSADSGGDGFYCFRCNCRLRSTTVADNDGDGLYFQGDSTAFVDNCILWDNTNDLYVDGFSSATLRYSCVSDTDTGEGVIHSDPLFVDQAGGDYRLAAASPCIDAGDGDTAAFVDFFGSSRVDDPDVTDTGTGNPAYIDIGFHERAVIFSDGFETGNTSAWSSP